MIRRSIDILVSLCALVLTAPLFAAVAITIRLKEGAPVFFLQRRAGQGGVPFRMIKFRTMIVNAEKTGGSLTYQQDKRITPLGGFLRRSKLDELPQLLNVLRGDMTLIGPRPEVLDWVERYTAEEREVLRWKPGLGDPVQLLFRHEQDVLQNTAEYRLLMPIKVHRQIEYLRKRTLFSDLVTCFRIVRAMFPSAPSAEELAVYEAIREQIREERVDGVLAS
jgi:lipopolysaccharide/colanic/teichoic acid biosynthesis glycosyltransferase